MALKSNFAMVLVGVTLHVWLPVCLEAESSPSFDPQTAQLPGILPLEGPWLYRLGADTTSAEPTGWSRVALPMSSRTLAPGPDTTAVRLRRDVLLDADWQTRIAPSGLAILLHGTALGNCQILAATNTVGWWLASGQGSFKPAPQVLKLPPSTVIDGRLRLELDCRLDSWAASRLLRTDQQVGEGWCVGDAEVLRSRAELLRLDQLRSDLPLMILALLFAAIGVYHLQLFRRDQETSEYLWFGVTALLVSCHTLLYTHWAGSGLFARTLILRSYDVTGALMLASSIQFLWLFLSRPINRWMRAYQVSFLILAAFMALAPEHLWVPELGVFTRAWSIPFLIAVAVLLTQRVRSGHVEARTIAVGGFAIVAAGFVEMTSQLLGKGTTFPLPGIAFGVFALSMAFTLSNRFSRVHQDLDVMRLQLEGMVEDRSEELLRANERLKSEISERELAQEAMHMLELAVEQSRDGILVADLSEQVLFVNESWAEMHARDAVSTFGRGIDLFHSPQQIESEIRPALEQVRREGSWEGEIDHCRQDGSTFPSRMSITLLRGPDDQPMGFVVLARDITERRREVEKRQRIEARIQEAEKLRSLADLAGGIAHDYNNLLTGVLGNSSLALRELPKDSLAVDKLVQIGSAAERAADLTAQLLAYAGTDSLDLKAIDLRDLVNESRTDLSRCLADGTRFDIVSADDIPEVKIDTAQVRQALLCLVINAGDAVSEVGGGVVVLETGRVVADRDYLAGCFPDDDQAPGEYVFLRVSDTGHGLPREDRDRIFDPFFSTKASARGLGLATVLSTIRAHRGAIKISSQPGAGAQFELLFPAFRGDSGVTELASRPIRDWRGSGTILVVDDEQIMREVSRSILEQFGFTVISTGEGQEALELYRRHREEIRLVLLDRTMPNMSGEEVLAGILAQDSEARVVLMSGFKKDAVVQELAGQGLTDFLAKPFRPEELIEKVRVSVESAP